MSVPEFFSCLSPNFFQTRCHSDARSAEESALSGKHHRPVRKVWPGHCPILLGTSVYGFCLDDVTDDDVRRLRQNPALEIFAVPTLENPRVGQPFCFRIILFRKGCASPLGQMEMGAVPSVPNFQGETRKQTERPQTFSKTVKPGPSNIRARGWHTLSFK